MVVMVFDSLSVPCLRGDVGSLFRTGTSFEPNLNIGGLDTLLFKCDKIPWRKRHELMLSGSFGCVGSVKIGSNGLIVTGIWSVKSGV